MNRDDRFLRSEYLKILFPVMFSVLGGTINALIDSGFVSQRLGSDGLAAVNMSMPVYLVICTFGSLIAGGASFMSAQALGEKWTDDARKHYHTAVLLSFLAGVLLTVGGVISCRFLATTLAQNGILTEYVYTYCLVTLMGAVPSTMIYIPLYYLQLEGKNRAITVMVVIMISVDVVLDYILMYVLDLGICGAALASVISILLSCVYGFVMLEKGYSNYHFQLKCMSLRGTKEIFRLGSPVALGNFVDALKLLLLNAIILRVGGTTAAAIWAVLNSLSEFSLSITSGVPQAAAPMAGAFYTARENSGLRILVRLQVQAGMILSLLYGGLLLILHKPLASFFAIKDNLLLPLACLGLFCMLDTLCSIWSVFFNSTGRIIISNLIIFCRKLIFPVGAIALLMVSKGYMWSFLPIGGILTLGAGIVITGIVSVKSRGGEHSLSGFLLLDDYLERNQKVLDFSIVPDTENICQASEQIKEFCEANNMDRKQTMRLGLAIEELMTVLAQMNDNLESVDLRAFALDDCTGIRIRYAGKRYNPFEDEEDEDFMMGIVMLQKMAEVVHYTYSLGMNTMNILFEGNDESIAIGKGIGNEG